MKLRLLLLLATVYFTSYAFSEKTLAQGEFFASPYGKNLILATYPGGNQAFIDFLTAHMKLPDSLRVSDTSNDKAIYRTDANFEIEKDGKVSDAILSNSIDHTIDEGLINAIKLSIWRPATSGKQPVRGGYFMQIYFIRK